MKLLQYDSILNQSDYFISLYFCNNNEIGPIQEGRGVLISGEGAVYEGFWKDGLQNGKGRIIYDDKSVYQGEFQNGVPEGFGIYSTFNGSGIKGFFQNGKIEGKGIEVWQDGSIYRGDFVNGRKVRKNKKTRIFTHKFLCILLLLF